MENQFPPLSRLLGLIVLCLLSITPTVKAQLDFTFNYSGPDTLVVDSSCTAILDWGAPTSLTVGCNNSGCMIIFFDVVSISNGYMEGDSLPAGSTVLITYYVRDNQGNDAFFGFDIDIVDTIPPMFDSTSMPASLNVSCLDQVPDVPALEAIVATDNCPPASNPPVDVVITYDGQSNTVLPCEGGSFTRTWTATDMFGNTSQYIQSIIIAEDVDPPTITSLPSDLTEACDTADYATWIANQRIAFQATDMGCGILDISDNAPADFMENCGAVTVVFTATDGCGLTSTAEAMYTTLDTEVPVISPPVATDITLECTDIPADPISQIENWEDNLTATDNCGNLVWNNDFVGLSGGCGGSTGTASVTYTVEDGCGQMAAITIQFTVEDNTPPNIDTPPADTTVACNGMGNSAALNSWLNNQGGAMASDICTPDILLTTSWQLDGNTVSNTQIQDALNNLLMTTCGASLSVDFVFTDACGNSALAPARFIITDMVPPVWDTDPSSLQIECDGTNDPAGAIADWLATSGNGTATDACGSVSYSYIYNGLSDDCGATGSVTVTFIAEDNCGNTATRTAILEIVDNTPPVWDMTPSDLEVECDGTSDPGGAIAGWLANHGNGSASDACSAAVLYTHDFSGLNNACGSTGSVGVTFTATDSCGLQSTQMANVSIVDTTPPDWIDDPDNLTIPCDGTSDPTMAIADWLNNNGNGTAIDICSGVRYSHNYLGLSPGCGNNTGLASVTFTATDSCGNASSRVAVVSVVDVAPPVWTANPTNLILNCGVNIDIPTEINIWLAANGNGMATDACNSIAITHDYNGAIPGCNPSSVVTVTFTATDECMNALSRTATIGILDNEAPLIGVPATGVIVDCTTPAISFVDWLETHGGAEATDACTMIDNSVGSPNWTANPLTPVVTCGNSYSQAVEFIVMDACGNSDTTTASYSVVDNTPPLFTVTPLGKIISCGSGNEQTALNDWIDVYGNAIISDGCGSASFLNFDYTTSDGQSNTHVPFGNLAAYPMVTANDCNWSVQVVFRIQDACGLPNQASATFFIRDNTAPVLVGVPMDAVVDCQNIPPVATVTATDLCDAMVAVTMTADTVMGVCPILLVITRTWIATDDCGNTSSAVQRIEVTDNDAPVLQGVPMSTTANCNTIPTPPVVTATDGCDSNPVVILQETDTKTNDGACGDFNYTITRIWTATDACGKTTTLSQQIVVSDTEAPTFDGPINISLTCDQSTDPAMTGMPSNVSDQCDPNPTVTYTDITSGGNCNNTFMVTRVWTAMDACGNVSADFEQTISISDTQAPILVSAAQDMELDCANLATANADFLTWLNNYGGAMANDNCTPDMDLNWFAAVPGSYDINDFGTFPGIAPGSLDTGICPSPIPGILRQETVDFVVYDNCANAIVSTASFRITDNNSPVFDACPSSQTIVAGAGDCEVDFILVPPAITEDCMSGQLSIQYSLNGGMPIDWTPFNLRTISLSKGDNVVTYYVRDCAGNASICNYTITIEDTQSPTITCPGDTLLSLSSTDDCALGKQVTLPLPMGIDDNCGFPIFTQTQPFNPQEALLSFSYNTDYQNYIAEDKVFNFIATAANAVGTMVTFTVEVEGDVDDLEEYFSIFGEDGSLLGVTEATQAYVSLTPGNCMANPVQHAKVIATIPVATSIYNSWAADGMVTITAVSNTNFSLPAPGGPSDGINPSCTFFAPGTPDGTKDGASKISMELAVMAATPYYYTTGATIIAPTPMLPPVIAPTLNFSLGESEVFYVISDLAGNEDTCSFKVTIQDTLSPVLSCQPTTIFINPSGTVTYTFDPSEIDNGSTDNCGIVSYNVTPNTFDCSQAGTFIDVTLSATDAAGNTATCTTIVAIETQAPSPTYSIGLCGNDTLSLMANPPAASGGVVYTYQWSGPNNFSSNLENPTIPGVTSSNSGTYRVEIRGLTGCAAAGTVEVLLTDTPNTPIITPNSQQLCATDNLVLTTQQYSGASVTYNWYAGIFPGGTYMASTSIPTYTIFAPLAANTNTYFVIVEIGGCVSDASAYTTVTVSPTPIATTNTAQIAICEGEEFALGTSATGTGLTYQWTGPNGYSSIQPNPPAFTNATPLQGGTYSLVVSENACPSLPATTLVNITDRPPTPMLASPGLVCAGEDVVFITNVANADLYTWIAPDFSTYTTTTNTLTVSPATIADAGNWSVFVTADGCNSLVSVPAMLFVEPQLTVIAVNNGPVCTGSMVQLSANNIPGASYTWNGPGGFSAVMQNPSTMAMAGLYSVTVTAISGCSQTASTMVTVNEVPQILAVTNTGTPCVTGAADITLTLDVFPADPGDYTYLWTGTGAFSSVAASPILPNATAAVNGNYSVVVTNAEGCTSLPMETTVNVTNVPATPSISGDQIFCEGSAFLLTTTTYTGGSVNYFWNTPVGTQVTATPSLNIPMATVADSGVYQVSVIVDGCASGLSAEWLVRVNPIPATPTVVAPMSVCAGDDLELSTDFIPGANYLWTGPAGFNATTHNPVILNAAEINEGDYAVQVTINGCTSSFSIPVNVQITNNAVAPTALNNGPICIDDPASVLTFSVSAGTAIPGASYTWYDALTNNPIAGPTTALTASLNDFSAYSEGIFGFYVIAEINSCLSPASTATMVMMNAIPNKVAFAGEPIVVCNTNIVSLAAQVPTVGTGIWTQVGGPTVNIVNPTAADAIVSGLQSNQVYTFQWTLSNGACSAYSSDQVMVTVSSTGEAADAGLNQSLCNEVTATLSATAATTGATGTWSQSANQEAQGVVIVNPNDPNTSVTGLSAGTDYKFIWTLSNPGCGEFSSDQTTVSIVESEGVAFAGIDFNGCADDLVSLNANPPASGQGTWTTTATGLTIIEPHNPSTQVQGFIDSGSYTFVWTLDDAACGLSSDEVVINFETAPQAFDDEVSISFAETVDINVKENDAIVKPFTVVVIDSPEYGQLTETVEGEFVYIANPTYAGADEFSYLLCSQACPDLCTEAIVRLTIDADTECMVPTIFTPNGDLVNDFFVIPCLATEDYPANEVSIYNQWGDEVFHAAPYQNDWQGTYKGEELPVGTYYFVVNFGAGQEPKVGFLVLEK